MGREVNSSKRLGVPEYEELKQNLPENETICFMDGVHPTHNVQSACGWIKVGKRKEIPGNSGRSGLNLSGVIDIISHKVFVSRGAKSYEANNVKMKST